MTVAMDWQRNRHFSADEFRCRCGCQKGRKVIMNGRFIYRLTMARNFSSFPFVINSGFRCESHNASVGGARTSNHKLGRACDISERGLSLSQKAELRLFIDEAGLRIWDKYETFIHVDLPKGWPQ